MEGGHVPNASAGGVYRTGDRFRCKRCWYRFDEFTGTYLARIRLPPNTVILLLYLFSVGVPAYRLRFSINVSLRSIEHAFMVFRDAIYEAAIREMKMLSGDIEFDEAMFGGHRKGKRGWGAEGKTIVFGIYARSGQVMTFPVPDRKRTTLRPLIEKHTKAGSLYYTDEHTAYAFLSTRGMHKTVTHSNDEFVRDVNIHINGMEGFWSYAKHWMYQYRGIRKRYFPLYLKEVEFRFNHRNEDLFPILADLLVNRSAK